MEMRLGGARATFSFLLRAAAFACVLGGDLGRADGSGQLGQSLQFHGTGAGFALVASSSTDAGTFVVAGLPPGAVVTRVFLYASSVASSPSITGATLNGQPVALTWIGTMPASVASQRRHAYRADVTSLVAGEGLYTWTTQSGGTNRGACLALFGLNPGDADLWEVQVRDGAHGGVTADGVEAVWPNPVVFGNFLGGIGWQPDAEMTWIVAGGNTGLQEQYLIEGTSVAGNDPAFMEMSWGSYEAASFVNTSTTSVTTTCRELGDAIVWLVGIFRVKVCEPCIRPFCEGDGSGPVACPCGNTGGPGGGCASSHGGGAQLRPVGTSRPDTLSFEAYGLNPLTLTLLFQGDAAEPPIVFGDGLRCVGGTLRRMYWRAADGGGFVTLPPPGAPSVSTRSALMGDPLAPGMTRWYQAYFRDATAAFCPPATFNATSGLIVPW